MALCYYHLQILPKGYYFQNVDGLVNDENPP